MESFGRVLRETRESKNINVETASRETSISTQYIQALETEKLAVFPGEPYAIGFLRNYSEYLGLDPEGIIALFRAKKIQEAPTPIELYAPTRGSYVIPVIICVAAAVMLGIGGLLWFILRPAKSGDPHSTTISSVAGSSTYRLSEESFSKRVYKGDVIIVPYENGEITLTVKETKSALSLASPAGELFVELGEEAELDIDGKSGSEIIVFVTDLSRTSESQGAEVRISLITPNEEAPPEVENPIPVSQEVIGGRTTVIIEDTRAYSFVITVDFRASCLLRYQTDRGEKIQTYFRSGQTLTMQANNSIRLWISNDTAVKMRLSADGKNHDLDMSNLGRIIVCDVRWTRDNSNNYRLVVSEVD